MDAFLVSTGVVALGEMGDKTQLLAIVLAARFRRPWLICTGILLATLVNHALAGVLGAGLAWLISPDILRWVVGISFLAMAVWLLVPDSLADTPGTLQRFGVLGTTLIMFFMAEMGDKTQIATIALAARYDDIASVVAGTTLGMMLVNAPVVFLGDVIARRVSMRLIHGAAALIFAVLGVLSMLNVGDIF
ncbi:MAG: TMEM165/GDT1 family protein [Alcaligenaceae bacterium]|nr:TMEM165/GDT1 family protein [Alcaligenaceae bacterium]